MYVLVPQNLYNDKVRKVVVMGLAPIGCAPYYLWLYSSKNGECVKNVNDMILEFNFAVRYMVSELNEELVDATIIFCDAFEGSMDIIQNHNHYGEAMCRIYIDSFDRTCHARRSNLTYSFFNFHYRFQCDR